MNKLTKIIFGFLVLIFSGLISSFKISNYNNLYDIEKNELNDSVQTILDEFMSNYISVFYKVDSSQLKVYNILPRYNKLDSSDLYYTFLDTYYNFSYPLLNYAIKASPETVKLKSIDDIQNTINDKKKHYIELLYENDIYINSLLYYLNMKGRINVQPDLYSVDLDKLIDMACKYYYVFEIKENNDFKIVFCGGGGNPYNKQPDLSTNILAEAFAFQALGRPLEKDISKLIWLNTEFKQSLIDTLSKDGMDLSQEDKLEKLREITWNTMKNDSSVIQSLLEEEQISSNIIPLRIVK